MGREFHVSGEDASAHPSTGQRAPDPVMPAQEAPRRWRWVDIVTGFRERGVTEAVVMPEVAVLFRTGGASGDPTFASVGVPVDLDALLTEALGETWAVLLGLTGTEEPFTIRTDLAGVVYRFTGVITWADGALREWTELRLTWLNPTERADGAARLLGLSSQTP